MAKLVSLDHFSREASKSLLIFSNCMSKSLKLVQSIYPLTLELLIFAVFSPLRLEEGENERETD